jgi:hypothetical protein
VPRHIDRVLGGVIVIGALGWFYDPVFAAYARLCDEGKTRVIRKIDRLRSYVDASGRCSDRCLDDLRDRTVSFVEITATGEALNQPNPTKDGLFQVRIRGDEPKCLPLFGARRRLDQALLRECLAFTEIFKFSSHYEFTRTAVRLNQRVGIINGSLDEFRERASRGLVASSGHYVYDGGATWWLPLPMTQSCGDAGFRSADLVE